MSPLRRRAPAAAAGPAALRLALTAVLMAVALWAQAAPAAAASGAAAAVAPGSAPRISVLTFGPGPIYWQRFGHNAILVREGGRAVAYNYGYFDFSQENFFLRFIRGEMEYYLATESLGDTLAQYRWEGREVREQRLDLSPAQARELTAILRWTSRPENAGYRYDYFLAACSTRIRDVLDEVTGGALSAFMHDIPARLTLRQQVLRLTAPDLPLMLGLDLILGPAADAPRSLWEESFVPEVLAAALRQAERRTADGRRLSLVRDERLLVAESPERAAEAPAEAPPALNMPFAAAGLLLAALLWLAARRARRLWLGLSSLLLLLAGMGGLVMLFIHFATAHWAGWYNLSVAYYNPLSWLLLPAVWSAGRGHALRRWQQALSWLLPAMALAGLAGAFWQQNLHHGLLWLPLHAMLAVTLLGLSPRRGRAS